MSSSKTVGRKLVIIFAIVIAILSVSLIGTIAYYLNINGNLSSELSSSRQEISVLQSKNAELNQEINSLQSNITLLNQQINTLQSKINQQNQLISSLQSQNAELQQKINSLQSQIAELNQEISTLTNIVNLQEQTTLVYQQTISQPALSYTYWNFQLQYAGYIVVYVYSSTTTNTYVEVVWSYNGINYDQSITVGASGNAAFPVLPTTVQVRVGNTNIFNGATETVSIVYVY